MKKHQNISIFYFRRYLDFKSSISHCTFMENASCENLKKCKSKKTYTQYLFSDVSHTVKIQNFDNQNWSDFFV